MVEQGPAYGPAGPSLPVGCAPVRSCSPPVPPAPPTAAPGPTKPFSRNVLPLLRPSADRHLPHRGGLTRNLRLRSGGRVAALRFRPVPREEQSMSEQERPRRKVTESGAVHDEREIEAVLEVLRSTTLDIGPRVEEFEAGVAELLAKQHGGMVNSGTSALRLAIDLLNCEPGDEVITSVLTFSSDVAPLVQSGIVPVFVDVEPDTYQIDVERIAEMIGPRTKGIMTPNLCGNCPDWDR